MAVIIEEHIQRLKVDKSKIKLNTASRSILEELSRVAPRKQKENVIENRGHHIISSAINFLDIIMENFDDEEADVLAKRFFSAIKNNDPNRFVRQIRKIKEQRDQGKKI